MVNPVYDRITHFLEIEGAPFEVRHHAACRTSEESAVARGESIRIGAKALLLKVDGTFALFVLSAARRLHASRLRKHFGARRSRFATRDELMDMTGLEPGSVPPFGHPIFDYDCYVDASVLANARMAFNAGSLSDSVMMATSDYSKVTGYESFLFSREAEDGS